MYVNQWLGLLGFSEGHQSRAALGDPPWRCNIQIPFIPHAVTRNLNGTALVTKCHFAFSTNWLWTKFTPGTPMWSHIVHKHTQRHTQAGRPAHWLEAGKQPESLSVHTTHQLWNSLPQWRLFSLRFEDSNPILNSFDYWSWLIYFCGPCDSPARICASPRSGPVLLLHPTQDAALIWLITIMKPFGPCA